MTRPGFRILLGLLVTLSFLAASCGESGSSSGNPSGTTAVTGGLTGRVVDQSGAPASGVAISLFEANVRARSGRGAVQGREVAAVQTDASGQFSLTGIGAGEYNLIAAQSDTSKAVQAIQITGGTQDLGTLGLQPTGTVSGRVLVVGRSAFAGIQVFLLGSDIETQTDATGAYQLSGVPAGSFKVFAASSDGSFAAVAVVSIPAAAGQTVTAPDLILVPIAGNFTGAVVFSVKDSETALPISGATIQMGTESRTSDASGLALFDITVVGAQQFTVTAPGYRDLADSVEVAGGGQALKVVLMIPTAQQPTGVKATVSGNLQVNVSWDPVPDPEATYDVLRSESEDTGFQPVNAGSITGTSFEDKNLGSLVTYFYRVRSVKGAAVSRLSDSAQIQALPWIYTRRMGWVYPRNFTVTSLFTLLFCYGPVDERTPDLSLIRQIPGLVSGAVQSPATGEIYLCESTTLNRRIRVLDANGGFLREWAVTLPILSGTGRTDLALDPVGNVWVVAMGVDVNDTRASYVLKYDPVGNLLVTLAGHSDYLWDVDTDSQGRVYVSDVRSRLVRRYSSTGTPEVSWGGPALAPGEFGDPFTGPAHYSDEELLPITVGPDDSVFVWSGVNLQIQKFTSNGVLRGQFGGRDNNGADFEAGVFATLAALDTDTAGNLYVLEGPDSIPDHSPFTVGFSKFGPLP